MQQIWTDLGHKQGTIWTQEGKQDADKFGIIKNLNDSVESKATGFENKQTCKDTNMIYLILSTNSDYQADTNPLEGMNSYPT